jgi:hypothetical protein
VALQLPWPPGGARAAGPDEFLKQQAPHLQKNSTICGGMEKIPVRLISNLEIKNSFVCGLSIGQRLEIF